MPQNSAQELEDAGRVKVTTPTDAPRGWSWGQGLAGAGVILSLVFVGTEIRQNTDALRGATFQQVSDARREMLLEFVHEPSLGAAFGAWNGSAEAWSDLPREARGSIRTWVGAYMTFLDNAYYQVRLGALPQSAFERWLLDMSNPRMREFWSGSSDRFTVEFRDYIDSARSLADDSEK